MLVPRLHKYTYMVRHIVTLGMNEDDAKADYVHHIDEIKAHVPADKVMIKASSAGGGVGNDLDSSRALAYSYQQDTKATACLPQRLATGPRW